MKDGFYEVGQERGGTARRAGSGKVEKPRGGEVTWAIFGGNRSQAYIKFTFGIC